MYYICRTNNKKTSEMVIEKTSEKVVLWMHRTQKTQNEVASLLKITRQTLATRLREDKLRDRDIVTLKDAGAEL